MQFQNHNRALTGAPPKDAEYSNLSVANTMVIRGKLFTQEQEAMLLSVLDLSTLSDVVVTRDLEVDGATNFHGPVSFDSAVSIPVNSIDLTDTLTVSNLEGKVSLTRQANLIRIQWNLINLNGVAISDDTVLFTLPDEFTPNEDVYAVSHESSLSSVKQSLFKVDSSTGNVTLWSSSGPLYSTWDPGDYRVGHILYLRKFI